MKNESNSRQRFSLGRMIRITRKELRETLRDRRTVITLVLMPLLVYPLLSISFNKSLLLTADPSSEIVFDIGVETEREMAILNQLLLQGEPLMAARKTATERRRAAQAPDSPELEQAAETARIHWFASPSLESGVANLEVQLAVRFRRFPPDRNAGRHFPPLACELIYRENSPVSERALRYVEDRLQAVNVASLRARLSRAGASSGLPAEVVLKPIKVGRTAPFSLATLVPLVLILMTITGAVYPAIDLTAGERERGTLETLIAAPISRVALLVAKYAAVLIVAVLTAMVNLLAMTVTLLTSSLGTQLFPGGLSPVLMIQILGLMILFAAFFSAIVLALTSFARSFKEAQAYLIPVMLLAISPGLLSLMPGLELTMPLAVAPLINIVLLSRDILEGNLMPGTAAVAILSTAVYAMVAIAVASKIFGNDALLYASRGSWSELFQRPEKRRAAPSPAATLACLATLFPCYFLLANLAQSPGRNWTSQLALNALVTVAVFGLCPVLFAVAQRVRLRSGFQLYRTSWLAFAGAGILGLTVWPFAHELFLFGQLAGLVGIDRSQFAAAEKLLETLQGLSPVVLLLSLALVPAAMEEFFFRGYLFRGLRQRFSGASIVVVSALLFGLFHVLSPSTLTPERFLPSTFLGLILGWVCYRTGSVLPGMLLHATHNGLLLMMVQNRAFLKSRGWDLEQNQHIPWTWLISSVAAVLVAATLIALAPRNRSNAAEVPEA